MNRSVGSEISKNDNAHPCHSRQQEKAGEQHSMYSHHGTLKRYRARLLLALDTKCFETPTAQQAQHSTLLLTPSTKHDTTTAHQALKLAGSFLFLPLLSWRCWSHFKKWNSEHVLSSLKMVQVERQRSLAKGTHGKIKKRKILCSSIRSRLASRSFQWSSEIVTTFWISPLAPSIIPPQTETPRVNLLSLLLSLNGWPQIELVAHLSFKAQPQITTVTGGVTPMSCATPSFLGFLRLPCKSCLSCFLFVTGPTVVHTYNTAQQKTPAIAQAKCHWTDNISASNTVPALPTCMEFPKAACESPRLLQSRVWQP